MATAAVDEGVRYKDKVTIVTGGSRGIGQACVELFAKHGSKVVVADILEEEGNKLVSALNSSGPGGRALFVRCDISKQDDVQKLIETTVETFGKIDCVINNAAFFLPAMTLDEVTLDDFRRIIDVNILGAFLVSKFAIKHLREAKGNIINITSMSGVHGQVFAMAYATTKAGLIGMTKTMAVDEAKNGVRINCVSPSGTNTDMFQTGFDKTVNPAKYREFYAKHSQFIGRLCEPVEVAKACLYLATDATYSTGQNIYVSGGTELDYGFKHQMEWFFSS